MNRQEGRGQRWKEADVDVNLSGMWPGEERDVAVSQQWDSGWGWQQAVG